MDSQSRVKAKAGGNPEILAPAGKGGWMPMIGHLQQLDVNIGRNMWRIKASGMIGQLLNEWDALGCQEVHPVVPCIKASHRMNLLTAKVVSFPRHNFAYCKAFTK